MTGTGGTPRPVRLVQNNVSSDIDWMQSGESFRGLLTVRETGAATISSAG